MISPDLPINKSSEDKLNRTAFAKDLAKVLLDYSSPHSFSVGLYGEWGSGKTSLLNMVLETIEQDGQDVVILRFNPWLCSEPKQLITQFFKQLSAAIKIKKAKGDRAWELIDQYADILDATSAIPYVGVVVSSFGKLITSRAKNQVLQKANDLQGTKNEIIKSLSESKTRIVVAIDDIDRLSEEEIVSVFQLVKALADFPNTTYLLAFDYDVVVKALSTVQKGDGSKYLEKVIQVPFEIPPPNIQSIHDTLFSKLNEILGDYPEEAWDKDTWTALYQYGIREYVHSIRDVIRYANVFYLKYNLLKEETDPVDLLGLTCLQVFEPLVYSKLPSFKQLLCGRIDTYSHEAQKADEEKTKEVISQLVTNNPTVANKTAATKILGILFPKVHNACDSYFGGRQYQHNTFLLSNKIAAVPCFDRYFSLMLEDDAISSTVIKYLVFNANEKEFKEHTELLYKQGKLIRFLEELEAYGNAAGTNLLPEDRATIILKCLAEKWHVFEVDDVGFFTIPFPWRFLFCSDILLKRIDKTRRYKYVKSLFENHSIQPSTLALLLDDFETSHGRFKEKLEVKPDDQQLLTLEEVISLEQVFKSRTIELLDSGTALNYHNGLNCLWMLKNIDPDLTEKKKKEIIKDDESLSKVLGYCFSHGVTSTGHSSFKVWSLDKKQLSEFIDPNEALQRINSYVKADEFLKLTSKEQMNIAAFLLVMNGDTASQIENSISEQAILRKLKELSA